MKKLCLFLCLILGVVTASAFSSKKSVVFNFQHSEVSQTGTPADVVLFTPADDSDYIASLYVENITPQTGSVQATLKWTDDLHQQHQDAVTATQTGIAVPIHVLANTDVILSMTDFGNSQTYNVYVVAIGQ